MTRGIKNNNPLNIRYVERNRWRGRVLIKKDNAFEEFISMDYGFLAAFKLLKRYIEQKHLTTPTEIISTWAPSNENNTSKYVQDVCRMTGIGGRENLTAHDPRLKDLVWAMAIIESGHEIEQYRNALDKAWSNYNG